MPVRTQALAIGRVVQRPCLQLPLYDRAPLGQTIRHVSQPLAIEYVVIGPELRRELREVLAEIVAHPGHNAGRQHVHAEGGGRILVPNDVR